MTRSEKYDVQQLHTALNLQDSYISSYKSERQSTICNTTTTTCTTTTTATYI